MFGQTLQYNQVQRHHGAFYRKEIHCNTPFHHVTSLVILTCSGSSSGAKHHKFVSTNILPLGKEEEEAGEEGGGKAVATLPFGVFPVPFLQFVLVFQSGNFPILCSNTSEKRSVQNKTDKIQ